eukprot:1410681-Prymnesium_polylepis.1
MSLVQARERRRLTLRIVQRRLHGLLLAVRWRLDPRLHRRLRRRGRAARRAARRASFDLERKGRRHAEAPLCLAPAVLWPCPPQRRAVERGAARLWLRRDRGEAVAGIRWRGRCASRGRRLKRTHRVAAARTHRVAAAGTVQH